MARRKRRKFSGTLDEEEAFYARLDAKHMVENYLATGKKTGYNTVFMGTELTKPLMQKWLINYTMKPLSVIRKEYLKESK